MIYEITSSWPDRKLATPSGCLVATAILAVASSMYAAVGIG